MHRFLPTLFVLVLLSSLCSAKTLGAGIVVQTTVKRVFEDGSFETLEFPTENQAGLEAKDSRFRCSRAICLELPNNQRDDL